MLDLPPELRILIYEALFEDDGVSRDIQLFEAHKYTPNIAITATCRLICQEALNIAKDAVVQHCGRQKYILEVDIPGWNKDDEDTPPDVRELLDLAASTASLPISACRIMAKVVDDGRTDVSRMMVRVSSLGELETWWRWSDHYEKRPFKWLDTSSQRLGVSPQRSKDTRFLHIVNILRALFLHFGWKTLPMKSGNSHQ